ncbi:MAG: radical SAM protein, partial [Candidatus Hydrothermia bacterium]
MKIGLMDVDGHNFPNLALMKLSAWHKGRGDKVEWCLPMDRYDRVYMAKVFDFTPDIAECIQADEVVKGGTGYGLHNRLHDVVEGMFPDYSLYGETDTAYGFMTRGCPRGCPFCIVGEKEGLKSVQVAELWNFWNGQKEIKLLDPNITAFKECDRLFQDLIDSKAWIDFTQGIDIRLMTEKKVNLLNRMKIKTLHFAWDNYEFSTYEKLKKFRPLLKYDSRKLR